MKDKKDRFRGMIIGTAVGDAIGLPAEGIGKRRACRMFKGQWRHRLIMNRGMVSDDTEHSVFTIQCLLSHSDNPDKFIRRMAMCLRWWLLSLPAGIGLATGRAILRLCVGISPRRSGVFSAGNGPAMRVAPIGAFFAEEPRIRDELTELCTRITHTDPKACIAARAIASTAAWIVRENIDDRPAPEEFIDLLSSVSQDSQWLQLVSEIKSGCEDDLTVQQFADRLGLGNGITGYIYHTVPVVLFAWYIHCGDYQNTLESIWNCGGDTDTTGAIAGGLAGLTVGETGVPPAWIDGIVDYPRSIKKMRAMADALVAKSNGENINSCVRYFWPLLPLRNLLFLTIVLLHGFRRLLPPY